MQTDIETFTEKLKVFTMADLRAVAVSLYTENREYRLKEKENEKINKEMFMDYNDLKERLNDAQDEIKRLSDLLEKEIAKNTLHAKSTYGRKSEKMLALLGSADEKDCAFDDESQAEDDDSDVKKQRIINFKEHTERKTAGTPSRKSGTETGNRTKINRLAKSMEKLPRLVDYDIDIKKMDEEYGAGNWRIANWHSHQTIEKIDMPFYAHVIYTPVISSGLEHVLTTEPYENPLIDRTYASASMLADITYRKFVLSLPTNRQEADYRMSGIELSKQTMLNWMSNTIPRIMRPVVDYMTEVLLTYEYTQNDETRILVNKDSRGPGHQSFMWVHCSSELMDSHPVVVFCYEATRNTNHLRDFFREFKGYITCDAYVSYRVFEKESDGTVYVTGCMMHCRRYLAEAFFINDVSSMTDAEILEMPETKALMLIKDIYTEENTLKGMNAAGRLAARKLNVEPKADAFFDYMHYLKGSGIVLSDRMNKAVNYALNQETYLRIFLTDGNICIDNGHAERIIRAYSVGRSNWLFADTPAGAELNALMYSVVETAKANGVNVRTYLKYLFTRMPGHTEDPGREFMEDMMPWSEAYRKYELQNSQAEAKLLQTMFPEPQKPRTPRKNAAIPKQPPKINGEIKSA